MAELRIRTARHIVRVAAPPERVYQLIAEVGNWPQLFDPIVTVDRLGFDGTTERVRIWELVDDDVLNCVSHRDCNQRRLQVRFRQEGAPHPVASMGGLWLVVPKDNETLVALDHYYRVVDDNPVDVRWLAQAIDRSSAAMLSALREAAERDGAPDLWLSCENSVDIDGDARDVYNFLARAQDWPQRMSHVDRIIVDEDISDIQHVESDIRLPDGSVQSTRLVRVCFPETHIVFKHTRPPQLMRTHTGTFAVATLPETVRASVAYTVLLRRDAIPGGSTVDELRESVRQVLHSLSQSTLGRAKAFAEARRPVRVGANHP